MRYFFPILLLLILSFSCDGCGSEKHNQKSRIITPPEEIELEGIFIQQWRSLLTAPPDELDVSQAVEIARTLAARGPDKLTPFFDVLRSPNELPLAKMLAVISLTPFINESHLDTLLQLTAPDYDSATRGCATNLLGRIQNPTAEHRVLELFNDSDPHVAKVATFVLLRHNYKAAVQKSLEMWNDPSVLDRDRNEILLGFPTSLAAEHLDLYVDGLCRKGIEQTARTHAIQVVGMLGNKDSVERIELCLASEQNPELRSLLEAAKAAILARITQSKS